MSPEREVEVLRHALRRAAYQLSWAAEHHVSDPAPKAQLRQESEVAWKAASDEGAAIYDCNICGGVVDLSNPLKPTAKVGPGRPLNGGAKL